MKSVDPTIKVTSFGGKFFGVRCVGPTGKVFMTETVKTSEDIGDVCREMLRWWDKLGGSSKYASDSRHRGFKKAMKRKI